MSQKMRSQFTYCTVDLNSLGISALLCSSVVANVTC